MASSCPKKEIALDKFILKLSEISDSNPNISYEITDIKKNIEEGMLLSSDLVKQGGKRRKSKKRLGRTRRGGMKPSQNTGEEILSMTDQDRSMLLDAMAHIIAVGTLTGGSGALLCYISPAIEAYLVSKGFLPMLCSGSGMKGIVEWGFRILAAPITNIETCMAIQTRYDIIVKQIIAGIGIPSGFGIVYERAKIAGGYMAYKNAVYNVLKSSVDGIKTIIKKSGKTFVSGEQEPVIEEEQIRKLVDQAILKEFKDLAPETPALVTPVVETPKEEKGWFASFFSSGKESSKSETPTSETPEVGYALSESFGGSKRRNRKRKTGKKPSRKIRKHRTRRHH
jgi:hypothetical protein